MQKNILLMGLVIVLTTATHIQAQYAKTDSTYRVGYHVKLFKDRAFIEPSVGIAYRPYQTRMPDEFRQKDDQWPKHTVEPGLHFGIKF